jgi:putative flavoprotein involved in K+ transport
MGSYHARNVIIATGPCYNPFTPAFARDLDPAILQVYSSNYCNPQQMPVQNILVVGAGNSGAEIGLDLAKAGKRVWLAGMWGEFPQTGWVESSEDSYIGGSSARC